MRKVTRLPSAAVLAGVLAISPAVLGAQVRAGNQAQQAQQAQMQQQTQEQMRQHAQALGESIQQMQRIQQRARDIQQSCDQQIRQIGQQQNLALGQQQRLRSHEQIRDMAQSISGAAGQMTQAMEGLHAMAQDPNAGWNGAAQGEMIQLRERLHQATGELEEGLQVMERLRQQLNQGG